MLLCAFAKFGNLREAVKLCWSLDARQNVFATQTILQNVQLVPSLTNVLLAYSCLCMSFTSFERLSGMLHSFIAGKCIEATVNMYFN